ncbi:hypothetical protein GCM10027046_34150 [Uliginosibacterium flavum]
MKHSPSRKSLQTFSKVLGATVLSIAAMFGSSAVFAASNNVVFSPSGTALGGGTVGSNSDTIETWTFASPIDATSVFLSSSFLVLATSSIDASDFVGVWLGDKNGPGFGIRGQDANNPVSDVFARPQYNNLGELAANQIGSINLGAGDSFSLLVNFYKTGGTTSSVYDGVRVWLNPTAADTSGSWDFAFTRNVSGSNISSFSSIGLRGNGLDSGDAVIVSGMKIGSSFASVSPVPEASGLAMLLAGLGMMGFIARRRVRL